MLQREIAQKIATASNLGVQEAELFSQFMNRLEAIDSVVNKWIQPGTDKITPGALAYSPYISATFLSRLSQTIPNNTMTPIDFVEPGVFGDFPYEAATTSIVLPGSNFTMFFAGQMTWATNTTGYRGISIAFYDEDDTYLYGHTAQANDASATAPDTFSFFHPIWIPNEYGGQGISRAKIEVVQTSGGDLEMAFMQVVAGFLNRAPTVQQV